MVGEIYFRDFYNPDEVHIDTGFNSIYTSMNYVKNLGKWCKKEEIQQEKVEPIAPMQY